MPAEAARLEVYNRRLEPHWTADGSSFWYRKQLPEGRSEYVRVDTRTGVKAPAFDHGRLADSLSVRLRRDVSPDQLPIDELAWKDRRLVLSGAAGSWQLDPSDYRLEPTAGGGPGGLPFSLEVRPSVRSGVESEITFVNRTDRRVQVHWLDGSAARHPYSKLAAGERYAQHTYDGHVWLVTDESGAEVIAVFEATERPSLAIIDGRKPTQSDGVDGSSGSDEDGEASGTGAETGNDEDDGDDRTGDSRTDGGSRSASGTAGASPEAQRLPNGTGTPSPDGLWTAFSRDDDLWLRNRVTGEERRLTRDGTPEDTYAKTNQRERFLELQYDAPTPPDGAVDVLWAPDSRHFVALRSRHVPERFVYLVESSPEDQVQPELQSYPYLKPGDEVPVRRPRLFDTLTGGEIQLDDALYSDPWGLYEYHWTPESDRCFFLYNQRGHGLMRVLEIDAHSGATRAIVDEQPDTFFDYSGKTYLQQLDATDELLWMSERDGWNHLYLYDRKSAAVKTQITSGEWVVRAVDRIDVPSRTIWFRAVGIVPGQDPYFVHSCRVGFGGEDLVVLTGPREEADGNGTHETSWAPDSLTFVDSWSRVDQPPIHVLRDGRTGDILTELEHADAGELLAGGRAFPEPFVAPGRDGITPIHGIIHLPKDFDETKRYPVIESIYAGPHGQHVPKQFRTSYGVETLADRGFVVVQIDGMGTNWRSKAFHDVCWKNLVDAGLPDRIAWIEAAAATRPYMDTEKVGIYGGSAGGQNALGALLTHGDFYDVAVADCGCHDNRMDKVWWNEQWMGYPVGPHYEEQSNVTLAPNLNGDLLLIVGELDRNVDPSSTLQVVHALVEADKDFDMLVIPGVGHGAASTAYGRRKLEEFFVRHLR
ncbi:MAG: prolyl oligopeptidase family serine peptidase [Candidatus Eisenbacteria bacterium]